MDKAKAAVSEFLHKDGKHHTTVHETTAPAVQHEHVTPTHHENVTTAIDRDVHQEHHHTTVQPIHHKEVLPEKHTHNIANVEEREIHHGDNSKIQQRVEAERAQFQDKREVGATQHTQSAAPTIAGEHVHHHVHEHIQPVVQKETIQPSVVHTTVPIHETHHNEAKHHTSTTLPPISMAEFQKSGHNISGHHDRTDHFEGAPRNINETLGSGGVLGGHGAQGATHLTERDGAHGSHGSSGLTGSHGTTGTHNSSGLTGSHSNTSSSYSNDTTGTGAHKKPSLMDKINPKVDANGDGKAGFMK